MKITAIIPARGGSKRLKKKNIVKVWGMPMIYWTIKACQDSKYDIDVWVSTEDSEIKKTVSQFNVSLHNRKKEHAEDNVFKQVVIRSAAKYIDSKKGKSDIYISVQANSPEINGKIIDSAIEKLISTGCSEIFSVDKNLVQNAAIRVFKGDYVYQQDLSTYCGVIICNVNDIHTQKDIEKIENEKK
jgi:CMP-N-acetylneuraminic acid synthetase|tara:strand:- start:3513 stop:4070 length:558 start_codon:yes stop_codon:yes gene_type:complete